MRKKETGGMRISGSREQAIQVKLILLQRERTALKPEGESLKEFKRKREENMRRDIR